MALYTHKGKAVKIIDRTLPEILEPGAEAKKHDIVYMCWLLKNMGVDSFEIDSDSLHLIGRLPNQIDFMYRIRTEEDVMRCIAQKLNACILTEKELFHPNIVKVLHSIDIELTLEYRVEDLSELHLLEDLRYWGSIGCIKYLRIIGLNCAVDFELGKYFKKLGEKLGLLIDICPENRFCNAAALALEAVADGTDALTVSFAGYSRSNGFAALEELFASAGLLMNGEMDINLSLLPEASKIFTRLSGINIPEKKPVIGKGIFNCESGIHADGIGKNPSTYEPFMPHKVGLERRFFIGKHSGKKALGKKLKELGLESSEHEIDSILKMVREKSIVLGRSLYDNELKELFEVSKCM